MRTKTEILKQAQDALHHPKLEVLEASKLQYLLIEVLIDIRDELSVIKKDLVEKAIYFSHHQ